MDKLKAFLQLMRPKQWTKNFVVFVGLIFSGHFLNLAMGWTALQAFIIFCITAGAVYIFNDIRDVDSDRAHPQKKYRPLAAKRLPVPAASVGGSLLMIIGLMWSFFLSPLFALVVLAYVLLNMAYSLGLKHVVILDVFIITTGFVLRAMAGAIVIHVAISPWLVVVTILLSLFLGFAKRRHELITMGDEAAAHRPSLDDYSPALLDQFMGVVASATIIAYSLYAFTSPTASRNDYFMLTVPMVIYGILRYLYLVYQKNLGGAPEVILLSDKPLLAAILLWIITVGCLLYII
jgi:4-hydroxybenzoate polyprenyltransferase